jgi:methylase of polypeptide subunit release factors
MMTGKQRKTRAVTEFGDFQTPSSLARPAMELLSRLRVMPRSILEPTCGRGSFLAAAATVFPEATKILGVDINVGYLEAAEHLLSDAESRVELLQGDFFKLDWKSIVRAGQAPWLIVGNPPWVTNAQLSAIESNNLPEKSNFQGRTGIEAITGKSNFDISEWMLLRYLDWLEGAAGTIAVLCKTAVARKLLLNAWKKRAPLHTARIYKIDALSHFGAAVEACFFVLETRPDALSTSCDVFESLDAESPSHSLGFMDGHLILDALAFNRHRSLLGRDENYTWRSGVKHDCSKVMELSRASTGYRNGLGETALIEDVLLYPMLKSSDIGNGRIECRSSMLVTQQYVGQDTNPIRLTAPLTWNYLVDHAYLLDRRGSVIYKNKPAFSIFGVGPYTFAPWKIAISGFYKSLRFVKVGPVHDKPVVFDDTIYFLPCGSADEAQFLESLLNSGDAQTFLASMIHWEEKRPVTVDILKRLSIRKLSAALGREKDYRRFATPTDPPQLWEPIEAQAGLIPSQTASI